MNNVLNCLKRLDEENIRINLPKCHFAQLELDWLGSHISQSGISSMETKTAFLSLEAQKTQKKLCFFLS